MLRSMRRKNVKARAVVAGCLALGVTLFLRKSPTTSSHFYVPEGGLPTPQLGETLGFDNPPVSQFRPQKQFAHFPATSGGQPPLFAVATLASNATEMALTRTYESLSQSSLPYWEWFVILRKSQLLPKDWLRTLEASDHRVRLVFEPDLGGDLQAHNTLMHKLNSSGAPLACILREGAMLEHTILEKMAWNLDSVPSWAMSGHFSMTTGQQRQLRIQGVHSGEANLERNLVPETTGFRLSVARSTGCMAQESENSPSYMWSFWLCLAKHGYWGGTIPELGVWIPDRTEPEPVSKSPAAEGWTTPFPLAEVPKSIGLEHITLSPLYTIPASLDSKSIMIVQGWLLLGGSELGFLEVLRYFAEAGYRVTMVLTRSKYPDGMALSHEVARFTNDIHFLPSFLRLRDFPRYITHLLKTRGVSSVLMSNSQLIYEILPALAEANPDVKWIDYLHNEAYDGWKTHGFPSFALVTRRYLARTLTCSEHLRQWLIDEHYPQDRIGVAKLGIDLNKYHYLDWTQRQERKSSVLGLPAGTLVLVSSARLDTQKRPLLVPPIIAKLQRKAKSTCGLESIVMLMMGDGPLLAPLRDSIAAYGLKSSVILLGNIDAPEEVLSGSDIFFLPSAIEGISIAIAEAMAIGLPVVTAQAGGLSEQLGNLGGGKARAGRLVLPQEETSVQVDDYVAALLELACAPQKVVDLGVSARSWVQATFNQSLTLPSFITEIERAKIPPLLRNIGREVEEPNPSSYFGLQGMATEDYLFVDLRATQRQLTHVPLPGLAGQLQSRCLFVDGDYADAWYGAVADQKLCTQSQKQGETNWLLRSAQEQCGAWCVWDLRAPGPSGWLFNGTCFYPFTKDTIWYHSCSNWWDARPAITLFDDRRSLLSGALN